MKKIEKQLKKEAKGVYMLQSESDELKASIIGTGAVETKPSPYFTFVGARMAFAIVAIFVVIGVPITYAAQESVPGDFLHRFEINFVEKIEEKTKLSSEARAEYHSNRLSERLEETESILSHPESEDLVLSVIDQARNHTKDSVQALNEEIPAGGNVDDFIEVLAVSGALGERIDILKSEEVKGIQDEISYVLEELNIEVGEFAQGKTGEFLVEEVSEDVEEIELLSSHDADSVLESYIESRLLEVAFEAEIQNYEEALIITSDTKAEVLKQIYLSE